MNKVMLFVLFVIVMGGCSNVSEESKSSLGKVTEEDRGEGFLNENQAVKSEQSASTAEDNSKTISELRKVIYNADLAVQVKNYETTVKEIQAEVEKKKGYIVDSNTYRDGEEGALEGSVTVRIPENAFHSFIETVEKGSMKVMNRSISGQDVTEEFVDLESRLKSKQVVEKRLLDFMGKAEKTEDLLKISTDLANVQEEIEQLKGRMNYLQNQVDLATITIQIVEQSVSVPHLQNEGLNTWDKTKKQFMDSVNFILAAGSGLIVFFLGNIPVFLVVGLVIALIVIFIRKKKRK